MKLFFQGITMMETKIIFAILPLKNDYEKNSLCFNYPFDGLFLQ